MSEQALSHVRSKPHRSLGGEILGHHRAAQSAQTQKPQHAAHFENVTPVAAANASVDDIRHHQRHNELKNNLNELEQRGQNTFFLVLFQILQ